MFMRGASSVYLYMQLVDVCGWVLLCVWERFQVCRQVMGGMRRGQGASKGWGDQGVEALLGRRHGEVSQGTVIVGSAVRCVVW